MYLQAVSCYALLSPDTILNPKPTGQQITLPFYPGHRYAAVPGSSINNKVQVDILPRRPESLVYHDHCFHLMDIKVCFVFTQHFLLYLLFTDSPRYPVWQCTHSTNLWWEKEGTIFLIISNLSWIIYKIKQYSLAIFETVIFF